MMISSNDNTTKNNNKNNSICNSTVEKVALAIATTSQKLTPNSRCKNSLNAAHGSIVMHICENESACLRVLKISYNKMIYVLRNHVTIIVNMCMRIYNNI